MVGVGSGHRHPVSPLLLPNRAVGDETLGALTPHRGSPERQTTRKMRLRLVTVTAGKPTRTGPGGREPLSWI